VLQALGFLACATCPQALAAILLLCATLQVDTSLCVRFCTQVLHEMHHVASLCMPLLMQVVQADLRDPVAVGGLFKNIDAIVCATGTTAFPSDRCSTCIVAACELLLLTQHPGVDFLFPWPSSFVPFGLTLS